MRVEKDSWRMDTGFRDRSMPQHRPPAYTKTLTAPRAKIPSRTAMVPRATVSIGSLATRGGKPEASLMVALLPVGICDSMILLQSLGMRRSSAGNRESSYGAGTDLAFS